MRGVTNFPYIEHRIPETNVSLGGLVMRCTAAAALKLGDVVYLSGTRTVNKSNSVSNHSLVCGVVVGGYNTEMQIVTDPAAYNVLVAADQDESVIVQVNGICYIIAKAAITVGKAVIPDTTDAGKVKEAAAITGAGAIGTLAATKGTLQVGADSTPVTSTAANGDILTGAPALTGAPTVTMSGDGFFRGVGKLLQASSADGDIRPILLTLGA